MGIDTVSQSFDAEKQTGDSVKDERNWRRWLSFIRPTLFSLAVAFGTAVISSGLYLGLPPSPPSLGFAGTGIGGLVLAILLVLVYRAWGWGSRRAEAAMWLTSLLSILGTLVFETGICHVLTSVRLLGPGGETYVQCSVNYLRGSRFGHILWGFLFTLGFWADLHYAFRSNIYHSRGLTHVVKGNIERAITNFDRAIRLKPDYAEAYISRGQAYGLKGDTDRAIADFDRAIHLRPDYVEAYVNRGAIYYVRGDYDLAIADYDRALQLRPSDAIAYYSRGVIYAVKGDIDHAVADFGKVLGLTDDAGLRQKAEELLERLTK